MALPLSPILVGLAGVLTLGLGPLALAARPVPPGAPVLLAVGPP